MELSDVLTMLLTFIGSGLVAILSVWIQYKKNKAEMIEIIAKAKKTEKEGMSAEGDIFLKWTQEFKERLVEVENSNKEVAALVVEQGKILESNRIRMEEQDDIIAKQSILLVDANARILVLEKENLDLKETVLFLNNENTILKERVSELEIENARLSKLENGGRL